MANSILKKKTREYVYREGDNFIMRREYLAAEVMIFRSLCNEVYPFYNIPGLGLEFYPVGDANEITEELWAEMIKNGNAYIK